MFYENKHFKKLPLYIFITAIIFSFINAFVQSKKEFETGYSFIISKIIINPKSQMNFYNKEQEIQLWNFDFNDKEDVKVGDLIFKKPFSDTLCIYRKDEKGIYQKKLERYSAGFYMGNWAFD